MEGLSQLLSLSGEWAGIGRLWLSPDEEPGEYETFATVAPAAGGHFARIDYDWDHEGQEQEGSLLIGWDERTGEASAVWVDSWHLGDRMMICRGGVRPSGAIDLRGSYPAPPGPDWGWRIELDPDPDGTLSLLMYNVTPEGQEQLAVAAEYEPTPEGP